MAEIAAMAAMAAITAMAAMAAIAAMTAMVAIAAMAALAAIAAIAESAAMAAIAIAWRAVMRPQMAERVLLGAKNVVFRPKIMFFGGSIQIF